MEPCLPADFYAVHAARRAAQDALDPSLGADAHVHLDHSAFVTGLRDWRSTPDTSARHPAPAADREWQSL